MENEYSHGMTDAHEDLERFYLSLSSHFAGGIDKSIEVRFYQISQTYPSVLSWMKSLYEIKSKNAIKVNYGLRNIKNGSKNKENGGFVFDQISYQRNKAHRFAMDVYHIVVQDR